MRVKLYLLPKIFFAVSFVLFFYVNCFALECSHMPLLEALAAMDGDAEVEVTTVPVGE